MSMSCRGVQEEAEKAAGRSRRADPFASGAVKFVEVTALRVHAQGCHHNREIYVECCDIGSIEYEYAIINTEGTSGAVCNASLPLD